MEAPLDSGHALSWTSLRIAAGDVCQAGGVARSRHAGVAADEPVLEEAEIDRVRNRRNEGEQEDHHERRHKSPTGPAAALGVGLRSTA